MKWSQIGIKTFKEKPAEALLPGQALLLRGGYIKKLSAGLFTYNPLFLKAIKKLENIVRHELNKTGLVEILMPMVQPKEIWEKSGRWELYADLLQKMVNRSGGDFCLGPTHEEVVSEYVKNDIKSWRDLPLYFYQIQTKFRDEIRPRFGLLRAKEFLMKDAYSFSADESQAMEFYKKMRKAYHNIFSSIGVDFHVVQADSGDMGGSYSEEFLILAEHGETEILKDSGSAKEKRFTRGIEAGHIFYLGDKYSKAMNVFYLNKQGKKQSVKMGCYGIGITRTVQAVIEQSHDEAGMIWPKSLSPCLVHLCLLDPEDSALSEKAENLYKLLKEKGLDVFLDDRPENPGVKFKDADLLGFPYRINLGLRDMEKGQVELVQRKTGQREKISYDSTAFNILKMI